MKAVLIIIAYFLAVVLLGALLAPVLYWAAHGLEPWALANGFLRFDPLGDNVVVRGPLAFLYQTTLARAFDRAILIAALLLLWPAVRALEVRGLADLRLRPDPRKWSHLLYGLAVAGGAVALMAGAYLFLQFYHLKPRPPWGDLPMLAVGALAVATLEEALFRGAILGLFLRSLRPMPALIWTSLIFTAIHYLKPVEKTVAGPVGWLSGFDLLGGIFRQFGDPVLLGASFATLLLLAWILGYVRLRTGALWMSIGVHAGVVFVKMSFSRISKHDADAMPWVGPDWQTGLVPIGLLLLAFFVLWRRLQYEELLPNPRRRD